MTRVLPKPVRRQREVLYMPEKGHSVVLGTAGSGKTTLALYRAAYLSSEGLPHFGSTLLLTFNQALVTYLNYLKPRTLKHVRIENYHQFSRGYLNSRGQMSVNCICDGEIKTGFIREAVSLVASRHKSPEAKFFQRSVEFFEDEIQWISGHGIATVEAYQQVVRVGRSGTRLTTAQRTVMFDILNEYRGIRAQNGKRYDWDDLAYHTTQAFLNDQNQRMYRHIIIDEGQDFSPEMLRSLAAAVPENGSLSFFGDVAQQIYGQRTSWRSAGLQIQDVWKFQENYRNSKQIAALALAISKMPYFDGIADIVEPRFNRADGPRPTVVLCNNLRDQIDLAVKIARSASSTKSVAILFKDREQERRVSSKLPSSAVQLHRNMGTWQDGPGIFYGTYHSAKGLEFDQVILPFMDSDNLPDPGAISVHGEEDTLTHDGRLLYVAVTRAKSELLLLYSGVRTSLLPTDPSLYQETTNG